MRSAGLRVQTHSGGGSLKSQMKKADSSGARVAVLLGESERAAGQVSLKWLRASQEGIAPEQVTLGLQEAIAKIRVGLYSAEGTAGA